MPTLQRHHGTALAILSCCFLLIPTTTMAMQEPNPPQWPESVILVRETDDQDATRRKIEATQDSLHSDGTSFTCDKHFVPTRTAILFAPGTYDYKFQVGYYVQVAGLGKAATDVSFTRGAGPYVPALNKHLHKRQVNDTIQDVGTCLDSFWRGAENFATTELQWAVSQAAPLRRVHVEKDVWLHDGAAYASGGHLANSYIGGTLRAGGQQQYLVRNVELSAATGGAWSMVYVGCSGNVPEASSGSEDLASITVVQNPRIRIEKPFVALKSDHQQFELRVPKALRGHSEEPLIDGRMEEVRDFVNVRVVQPGDPIESIQQALDAGKDVVLTPGIYGLKETLQVRKPNQVLLGLGLATLEAPKRGGPCVHVQSGVPGVRIAGIMLEAVETNTSDKFALLEWGEANVQDAGDPTNPGALFDVFVRVGGATAGDRTKISVDAMMRIHSGHVVGDNLWIWRADHAELGGSLSANYPDISPVFWQCEQDEYRAETGIEVTGDDVTMFGLAVEHANRHQTVWSGQNGAVYFYQCEFPYGVDTEFADKEYRGYLIADNVKTHELHAPGVYSNFRNTEVFVSTAIEHPNDRPGVKVVNPFTVKLDNQGGIKSIVNGKGPPTRTKGEPTRHI